MSIGKVFGLTVFFMLFSAGAFIEGVHLGKLPTVHYVDCFEGDILIHQGTVFSCHTNDRVWRLKSQIDKEELDKKVGQQ